jgi:ribosome maturation factor RimP
MSPDPRLFTLAENIALRHQAHLVDLVQRGHTAKQVVEVYLDNATGVTVELCTEVSRELLSAIDAEGVIEGGYRLDVSSPGIDRPLRHPWQYSKHVGRQILVRLGTPTGTREVRGELLRTDDLGITLRTSEGEQTIPFAGMQEGRVVAPW